MKKKVKLEVIKLVNETDCYCCHNSINGKAHPRKGCEGCGGDGRYKETHYIHIVGNIAVDGDTIK
jgi:hypothetical protein